MPNPMMASGQPTRPLNSTPGRGGRFGSVPTPPKAPVKTTPAPAPSKPAPVAPTVQNVAPDYMQQIAQRGEMYRAPDQQIQAAAQQIMPMYQARLSGLQGPTMDAMRLNAQQDIQAQYGNALRSAMQQAGNQGIRGPAAVAMQQDIRNQMGQAQAKYSRDMTIADWDAKTKALADYYGAYQQQAGLGIGTPAALQQLQNVQTGYGIQGDYLRQALQAAQQRGGGLSSLPLYNYSAPYVIGQMTGINPPQIG